MSHKQANSNAMNGVWRGDRREKKYIAADLKKLKNFLSRQTHKKNSGEGTLNDLPWYLVMGEEKSGKTSFLRASGLSSSYQSYHHPAHHSSRFQWIVTEEAAFFDLPHYFCQQQNMQQKFNWLIFLKYFKRMRPHQLINGLILTINVSDLVNGKLNDWQEAARISIHELQQKLKIRIPVYLVITHVDCIAGFSEFVAHFTEKERAEVLGITYSTTNKTPIDQFLVDYDKLVQTLNLRLKRDLDHELGTERSTEMCYFPMQMAALSEKLLILAKGFFAERRYFTVPSWRGIYFVSSANAAGKRINVLLNQVSARSESSLPIQKEEPFFIRDLFPKVILREAQFIGLQPFHAYHYHLLGKVKLMVLISMTVGFIGVWSASMLKLHAYNTEVREALSNSDTKPDTSSDSALNSIFPQVENLAAIYHQGYDAPGAWLLHLGLIDPESSFNAVQKRYQNSLDKLFVPYLLENIHTKLNTVIQASQQNSNEISNIESLYNWLAIYVMFNQTDKMDKERIKAILNPYFDQQFAEDVATEQWLSLRLDDLLHFSVSPQNLDQTLIENARAIIENSPLYIQAYFQLKQASTADSQKTLALTEEMSVDSAEVFSNTDAAVVPLFFTKQGYNDIYAQKAPESLSNMKGEGWVLGENTKPVQTQDFAVDQAKMDSMYWTDYLNSWDSALSQINIAPFQNMEQAIDSLTILGGANSPLISIVKTLGNNSNYGEDQLTQDAAQKNASVNALENSAQSNIVTEHYQPLANLLSSAGNQQSMMQNTQMSLTLLAQYLNSIQSSSNTGLSAYNAAVAIFAGEADKSITAVMQEAETAPSPLSRWLNQIVANTYAVIFSTASQYLSNQWQAEVYTVYQNNLAGRFPFASSDNEVAIQDFNNFFKPEGVEDSFVKKYLSPFLVNGNSDHAEWGDINNVVFNADTTVLNEISAAAKIRESFFGGNNGVLNFTLSGENSSSSKAILAYDNKSLNLGDTSLAANLTWPAQNTDGAVSLTFHRYFSDDLTASYPGPWGWFHLIAEASSVQSKAGNQYEIDINDQGNSVNFVVRADSAQNPFDLKIFRNYNCPAGF